MNTKEIIRKEIERIRSEAVMASFGNNSYWLRSRVATCVDLLSFIDSLPDEECFADVGKTSGVPKKERPKVYEATCVDFDDDGTPIFYGDGKVPDLELDDKITFRVWWKKRK